MKPAEQTNIAKAYIYKEWVSLVTYPFSDPSPIPEFGRLYPYNRFDGYTAEGASQDWEMVVMENRYIKVWINPAVGGKVWGAIEKSTGKEFIYFNHAAKFRDVAMRGPWTSGGMETNMGIIGHTPSCSCPVDYHLRENNDGSVSCFVGATDWPSRTEWRVEFRLNKDTAYLTTNSWWYNHNVLQQAYYQWNNVGIKVNGNLEYVFPGNYRLGHDGKALSWPADEEGREISFYDQNNYGEYKSYHVFGAYSDFWGCYWHEDGFGMGHSASYDDKPGKKIWIWGLSRYGMVWEDLLTDTDGQYTEVQSGRLFNQSIAASSKTPFKHQSFLPYTFDSWQEHWFPVKQLGGLSYSARQFSFYLNDNDTPSLNICANEPLTQLLKLVCNGVEVIAKVLSMEAMDTCSIPLPQPVALRDSCLWLDDELIYNGPEQHKSLNRPAEIAADYNFESVQALCMQAREWEKQRFFERALNVYQQCLQNDPFYLDALTGLAGIYIKQLKFTDALQLVKTALSVDTYHGEANYMYGLINVRLAQWVDAKDGFSIASQNVAYRSAAYTELAKLFIAEKQLDKALNYVSKAKLHNPSNLQIHYLEIIIWRLKGNNEKPAALAKLILNADPLSYIASYEQSLATGQSIQTLTQSELPYETYLEMAAFYSGLKLYANALNVLSLSPPYALVSLWQAYLYELTGSNSQVMKAIAEAEQLSPFLVFPHREEDVIILNWALKQSSCWKFRYYLALAYNQNLRQAEAVEFLNSCQQEPDFYPFYIVRANLRGAGSGGERLADSKQAVNIAPKQWRTSLYLSKHYAEADNWAQALAAIRRGYEANSGNYYLCLQLARCLMQTGQYEEGIALMNHMVVLPNEGASDGRNIWRETHLHAALAVMRQQEWGKALQYISEARKWPENLGIGKPYDVDERLEDYMELLCLEQSNQPYENLSLKIAQFREYYPLLPYGSTDLLSIMLLQEAGDYEKVESILNNWIQQDPNALALQWSQAVLQQNDDAASHLAKQPYVLREALPYEILFDDRAFAFIKQLYGNGLLSVSGKKPSVVKL